MQLLLPIHTQKTLTSHNGRQNPSHQHYGSAFHNHGGKGGNNTSNCRTTSHAFQWCRFRNGFEKSLARFRFGRQLDLQGGRAAAAARFNIRICGAHLVSVCVCVELDSVVYTSKVREWQSKRDEQTSLLFRIMKSSIHSRGNNLHGRCDRASNGNRCRRTLCRGKTRQKHSIFGRISGAIQSRENLCAFRANAKSQSRYPTRELPLNECFTYFNLWNKFKTMLY